MKELLVLPLLMPLGLALVVGLLNLTTPSRLKFLLWSSPPLSLGSWVMLGAGGGAALSAALSATAGLPAKRKPKPKAETCQAPAPKAAPSQQWPERDPQEPAPTVSVPFRVVNSKAEQQPDWDQANDADW